MFFSDRRQAGEKIAIRLDSYRGEEPLILAVPRGGIAVAEPVWERLGGEIDLIITRKIGAPFQPELAVGAVSGDGFVMINEQLVSRMNIPEGYIESRAAEEQAEINRRLRLYRGDRPFPSIDNRLVILVDDGVATGYTLLAALRSLQQKQTLKLILAVPVGPPDTLARLAEEVDELVYLEAPPHFTAVGQFYVRFDQVGDAEVINVLQKAWGKKK
ncbi:MAG TPA: phosphoribosyltransferase [Firmicutes bacterium]|nr:phosphoribosyltransferase [Bacillota bacterium]